MSKPKQVRVATVWEVVEGEDKGRYLIETHTEDDLPDVMLRINQSAARQLRTYVEMLREDVERAENDSEKSESQ
jgi:hypothetical protein